jgi:hypothetical protein
VQLKSHATHTEKFIDHFTEWDLTAFTQKIYRWTTAVQNQCTSPDFVRLMPIIFQPLKMQTFFFINAISVHPVTSFLLNPSAWFYVYVMSDT